jgi:hypothetical protein
MSSVSSGDQLPIYSPNNGDARRVSIGALLDYFEQTFASPTTATNIYTPGTGFNIAVPTPTGPQWILIQPAGTLATGTVTLPLNTITPDGTEVLITTTQQITTFTLAANGASHVYGDPSTLAAEDFFKMRFVQSTNSWYRIS